MIITISRQPGCGGLEIGQRLARRLDVPYVDKRTVEKAIADLASASGKGEPNAFWSRLSRTPILQDIESYIPDVGSIVSDAELHENEADVLRQIVGEGPAVVVGRGGFHRFADHPRLMNVFLSGAYEYRLANYRRLYRLDRAEAADLLDATDQATQRYVYKVTGKELFDVRHYHLAVDVSRIDFNRVVECVIEYAHYYDETEAER